MKLNQKGFSGVEALLIVVIVAIIGGVGYYVYQSQQETKKSQDNANKSSQEIEAEKKTEPAPAVAKKDYFEIKELGVKFEKTEKLKGLYYFIGNEGKTAYFSLDEFKGTSCAADKTAQSSNQISVTRSVESDYAPNPGTQALKQEAQKLGNFYYQIDGAQSYCSEDKAIQAKTTKMIQDVREAIKGKLELIQ